MDPSKINIGLLEGKSNWIVWKYKMSIMLRGIKDALNIVEGKLEIPKSADENATVEEKAKYEKDVEIYMKKESNILLLITINLTQETLEKVMRFTSACEVWQELHRLYDGNMEDKTYDLCMQFFSYKKLADDDIATHTSKLKNIWNELQLEITKEKVTKQNACKCDLPVLLLICKILGTLPEDYFSFKSSWMLINQKVRTIDNLTNQLCAYEKALSTNNTEICQEALIIEKRKKFFKKEIVCHYCKEKGHMIRECSKWIKDGRPPKEANNDKENTANTVVMSISAEAFSVEHDHNNWFVDNGATSHITNRRDIFKIFKAFPERKKVTTANGDIIEAIGKGDVVLEVMKNGRREGTRETVTLKDVWYIPAIKKNLFSVLAAHDYNTRIKFLSTYEECYVKLDNEIVLTGRRSRYGGLFKLMVKNVISSGLEINEVQTNDLLQLYHERFGHQNKRHIKK